jgi:hypothetical protein
MHAALIGAGAHVSDARPRVFAEEIVLVHLRSEHVAFGVLRKLPRQRIGKALAHAYKLARAESAERAAAAAAAE